uniref:Secreted protein n=1 Tax=Ascaris lumbricoides TaxID=6252 RepID=A0A0M3IQJ6_ASCLU
MLKVLLLCGLIALAQCGILDDIKGTASDVGEFFSNKFNDFKSLFANNESELEKNVQRVKDLLATIQEKAGSLRPIASDAQKTALDKVDEMSGEVDQFQQKLKSEVGQTFEQKKAEWEKLLQRLFQTEGLQQLVNLVQGKTNGVAPIFASMFSLMVPVLLILRH